MSVVSFSPAAGAAPIPQAGPTPRPPAARPSVPAWRADSIAAPVAAPSPGEPNLAPPGEYAALPVLAAAGLIAGAAAVALPEVAAAGAGAAEAAGSIGSAFARGAAFAKTAAREFAAQYRDAAAEVADIKWSDPQVLGKTLGAQAWTATEELVRGAIAGAGLAGAAWAAGKLGGAAADAIAPGSSPAAGR